MTSRRPANIDRPALPPPAPPTLATISADLGRLALAMDATAAEMVYLGGFGEVAAHGLDLAGAAAMAREWARGIRRDLAKKTPAE